MSDAMVVRPQNGSGTQIARQGFGEQGLERRDSAAVAVAERAKAEVQAMCIMAMNRPRNLDDVRVRLLAHAKRSGFAAKARYSKPIGTTSIEGPSIRFVETALQEYGNVMPEATVVHEDDETLRVRVSVYDLERNIKHAGEAIVTKRVERKFLKRGQVSYGQRLNSYDEPVHLVDATDDEVANKKASAESKLIRNLGLRILPADLVDEAMELCVVTIKAGVSADPAGERKKLMDAFAAVGVMPAQVVEHLGHPLDAMQPAELVELRYIYQALRDGESTWAAVRATKGEETKPAADAPAPARGNEAAKAKIASRKKAEPAAAPVNPATDLAKPYPIVTPAHDPTTGDGPPPDDIPNWRVATPEEIKIEARVLVQLLERVIEHPATLPDIRARVDRLPGDHPDRKGLLGMVEVAERAIAKGS